LTRREGNCRYFNRHANKRQTPSAYNPIDSAQHSDQPNKEGNAMLTIKPARIVVATMVAISMLLLAGSPAVAAQAPNLNLTTDQVKALESVVIDLSAKQFKIESELQRTLLDLKMELQRSDRFATKAKADEAARNANKLVKKLVSLYGDMLKVEVEYLLKAKDVLTREQRMQLIRALDFDMDTPQGYMEDQDVAVLVVDLELTEDQQKKILGYRAKMQKKEAKFARKIQGAMNDLENALSKDKVNDSEVNRAVKKMTNLAIDLMETRVGLRLKAKDVLTVEQKQKLLHLLFLSAGF
jgi:Spy/CpxP family protein refolding chaperone